MSIGEKVIVDLDRITVYAALFLNSAFGRLLKDFSEDHIAQLVEWKNGNSDLMAVLKICLETSRDYYSMTEDQRKKHNEILLSSLEN